VKHIVQSPALLLSRPSYTQTSTSISYSQSLSAHVFPSVCETKFHTHINTTGEMILVVLRTLNFILGGTHLEEKNIVDRMIAGNA
jgi:hypothetical protein